MKKNFNLKFIFIFLFIFSVLIMPSKVNAAVNWVWPTKDAWRVSEISDKGMYIPGKYENNLDVVAARQGTVVQAITEEKSNIPGSGFKGYGSTIVIKHANNQYTLYAHLASINVKVGQKVTAGTKIGTIGDTGVTQVKTLLFAYLNSSTPTGATFYDPIKDIYWNKYADKIKYSTSMRIARNNSFYDDLFSNYYKKDGALYVRNNVPFSNDFTSKYTATAFGEGNIYIICGVAGAFIVVCVCAFIFIKKKNKKDISKDSKTIKEKK